MGGVRGAGSFVAPRYADVELVLAYVAHKLVSANGIAVSPLPAILNPKRYASNTWIAFPGFHNIACHYKLELRLSQGRVGLEVLVIGL